MPLYQHPQELKRAEQLIGADHIGVCLTCKYWEVEKRRSDMMAHYLSLCMQPELEMHQLMVTGSSGCNKWQRYSDVAESAEHYAHRGEFVVK